MITIKIRAIIQLSVSTKKKGNKTYLNFIQLLQQAKHEFPFPKITFLLLEKKKTQNTSLIIYNIIKCI